MIRQQYENLKRDLLSLKEALDSLTVEAATEQLSLLFGGFSDEQLSAFLLGSSHEQLEVNAVELQAWVVLELQRRAGCDSANGEALARTLGELRTATQERRRALQAAQGWQVRQQRLAAALRSLYTP